MFERFTQDAQQVVVKAQGEARDMRQGHIGTEHLLVALAGEPEVAALGLDPERARAEVVKTTGLGDVGVSGRIPFTAAAKEALEESLREAMRLGQREVGPGHLLLAVLKQRDGVARRILVAAGATPSELRERITQRLAAAPPPGAVAASVVSERVTVALNGVGFGAIGSSSVDAHLLSLILDRDGAVAAWLRERGVTEDAVRRLG
ncbi:Clp protease N-terminal domain-containing protein [Solirubrobacter soli]|uniref:Clp protease N-terminal domain-containing protein n=1 Tax=Solirubrobacter soli TaxID=363832 RepID=UPI000403A1AB|nr:Clp protease N-terminal domain-containing protein [Solirubrobacter soli]